MNPPEILALISASPSREWSRFIRVLFWVAVAFDVVVTVWMAWGEDLEWVPYLLGGLALLLLVSLRWPLNGFIALMLATAIPHYPLQLNGWNARADHFAAAAIIAIWVLGAPFRNAQRPLRWITVDYLLAAYVLSNYLSSVLMSPERLLSLRWAVLTSLVVLPYFFIRVLAVRYGYVGRVFRYFLTVGVLAAAYGIFCFLLHRIFGTTLGVELDKYAPGIPGYYGSLYDSNNFGIYSASCSIMFLALYLFGKESYRRRCGFAFLITAIAMVISLARAAMLGFTISAVFLGYLAVRRGILSRRAVFRLAALGSAGLLIASFAVGSQVGSRFSLIAGDNLAADSSVRGRVVEDLVAAEDISVHPILGNGTGSFHILFRAEDFKGIYASLEGADYSLTDVENLPLRVLHDTGVIGFALFSAVFVFLALRIRKLIKQPSGEALPMLFALTAATLLDLVAFQFSDESLLAFFWIHVGLLVSFVILLEAENAVDVLRPARI